MRHSPVTCYSLPAEQPADIPQQPVRRSPVTCYSLTAEPQDIPQQPAHRSPVTCYSLPDLRVRLPGRAGAGAGAGASDPPAPLSPLAAILKGSMAADAAAAADARPLHRPAQRRMSVVRFLINGHVLGDATAGEPELEPEATAAPGSAKRAQQGTMAQLWQPCPAGAPVIVQAKKP